MRSSRQGAIPSPLGDLIDELDDVQRRLRTLEAPSGESMSATVDRLAKGAVYPVEVYQTDLTPAITPAAADFATVNVAVPFGYTRALVSVAASATLRSGATAGVAGLLTVASIVTGVSAFVPATTIDGGKYGSGAAASAGVVVGLAPGDIITARARVSFPHAYANAGVNVSGSILFLR